MLKEASRKQRTFDGPFEKDKVWVGERESGGEGERERLLDRGAEQVKTGKRMVIMVQTEGK